MKRGQVWVETVIYTLIGLVLIGVVLGIVSPKISQYKDRAVIEQSVSSLSLIDLKIEEVKQAPGNRRFVNLGLKEGELYFDRQGDEIIFELKNSNLKYSEPDVEVGSGVVTILTKKNAKKYDILLNLSVGGRANLDFDGESDVVKLSKASVPYKVFLENRGFGSDGREIIFVELR